MRALNLVVLAYEGPQGRAYLSALRRAGVVPRAVVHMVLSHHPSTDKPLGRWLPRQVRVDYAHRLGESVFHHWPRQIHSRHPELVAAAVAALESTIPDAASMLEEIRGSFDYSTYAEELQRVLVRDLQDPELGEALAGFAPTTVLYTGGGIVRRGLLDLEGLRFLHVHPGTLPHVRGADGLLWSILVRGRPGVSCFYMAPGVDVGEVITAMDAAPIRIRLGGERPDDDTLYRALFSYCDPLLRAAHLVQEVIPKGDELDAIPAQAQDLDVGVTYHFMHPTVRAEALKMLFV